MTTLIRMLLLTALAGAALGARGNKQKDVENLRSAVVVNQLILQQQAQTLQKLLVKFTQGDAGGDTNSWCPYPYKVVSGECFYVSGVEKTWAGARRFCQGLGGDLASPNSVYTLAAYVHETTDESVFWLGATDMDAEGVWRWLDGRAISDWSPGQPDNQHGEEHCIHLGAKYLLNDNACDNMRRFVCEYAGAPMK